MERATGIEPVLPTWEAERFRPTLKGWLQSRPFGF